MDDLDMIDAMCTTGRTGRCSAGSTTADGATSEKSHGTTELDSQTSASGYDPTTPPSKRRPWHCGRIQRSGSNVKLEPQDAIPEADATIACAGCFRLKVGGRCYLDPAAEVQWGFPDGRGAWCRDCHSCWRTVYQSTHTLSLFGQWIRNVDNYAEYMTMLLAYITLVAENLPQIRAAQVHERAATLKLVCRLLGVSVVPSVVVLLEDALSGNGSAELPKPIDPNRFLTIRTSMGDRLGVLVTRLIPSVGRDAIARPISADGPMFGQRHMLSTNSGADREFLRENFADDEPGVATPRCLEGTPLSVKTESRPQMSKLEVRMQVLRQACAQQLAGFGGDAWESMKESAFTKVVNQMGSFHAEAGNEADVIIQPEAEAWLNGVRNAKRFMKLFKEYSKSKGNHAKVLALAEPMLSLRAFLIDVASIQPAGTFDLLAHKVAFYDSFERSKSIGTAVKLVLDKGVATTFRDLSGQDASAGKSRLSADLWFRTLIQFVLPGRFSIADDSKADPKFWTALLDDCLAAAAALRAGSALDLKETLLDLDAVSTLLGSAADHTVDSATALNAATLRLEPAGVRPMVARVDTNDIWRSMLATAATLLQSSSKDSAGDAKMDRAIAILEDPRLPKVSVSGYDTENCEATVQNFSSLTDMSVMDSLDESLAQAAEAVHMWSSLRMEQNAVKLDHFANSMTKNLSFFDECLCVFTEALCRRCEILGQSDGGDIEAWPTTLVMTKAWSCLNSNSIDEGPMQKFSQRFIKFLDDLPVRVKSEVAVDDYKRSIRDVVLVNIDRRAALHEALLYLTNISEMPQTPQAVLEDWQAKRQHNGSSFLSKAIDFLRSVQKVSVDFAATNGGVAVGDVDEIHLVLSEGDGRDEFKASFNTAMCLPTTFVALPYVAMVTERVRGSVQLVFDDFVGRLHLDMIVSPIQGHHDDEVPLASILGNFYRAQYTAEVVKVAGKLFAPRSTVLWPCVEMQELAERLINFMPEDTFDITITALCHHDDGMGLSLKSKNAVLTIANLLVPISQVVTVFVFVSVRFLVGKESITREHKIKEEVLSAVSFARTTISKAEALQTKLKSDEGVFQLPLKFNIATLDKWLARARLALGALTKHLHTVLMTETMRLSTEVEALTPRYSHIITDEHVNVAMAKKQLLSASCRKVPLSEKVVKLFHVIGEAKRLQLEWSIAPSASAGAADDDADSLAVAHSVFVAARAACTTVAALRIVYEFKGKDQVDQAVDFVKVARLGLSKLLQQQIDKIASSRISAPAGAGATAAAPSAAVAVLAAKEEAPDEETT